MKKFRKIMAVLVAAIMVVAMTVPAWADSSDYTITINNPLADETYTAYKIFDAPQPGSFTETKVNVSHLEVQDEANKLIEYWYDDPANSGTARKIEDSERADWPSSKQAYQKLKKPISYTISASNPWKATVDSYATAHSDELKITEIAGAPGTYLVEFVEGKFRASTFAQTLKGVVDSNAFSQDTYKPAATTTVAGTANGSAVTSVTLGVGKDGTDNDYKGAGYYFVDTTTGSLCALNTTSNTATVFEKNTVPTETKEVYSTTDSKWPTSAASVSTDDAQVGDKVYFRLTITDGVGTDTQITVADILSSGLSFDGSDSLSVYKLEADPDFEGTLYEITGQTPTVTEDDSAQAGKNYYTKVEASSNWVLNPSPAKVKDSDEAEVQPTFTVVLSNTYVKTLTTGSVVVICYSATLTKDAVMASTANTNKTFLRYANQSTPTKTVNVYSHAVDLVKYDGESGASKKLLSGATFNLYRANQFGSNGKKLDGQIPIKFTSASDFTINSSGTTSDITFSAADKVTLKGLDVGEYYLVETVAPLGYKALTTPIKISVTRKAVDNTTLVNYVQGVASGSTITYTFTGEAVSGVAEIDASTYDFKAYTENGIGIPNVPGKELPTTGGMGTTVLYIVGGMLVILAGAYLFFSRKKTA